MVLGIIEDFRFPPLHQPPTWGTRVVGSRRVLCRTELYLTVQNIFGDLLHQPRCPGKKHVRSRMMLRAYSIGSPPLQIRRALETLWPLGTERSRGHHPTLLPKASMNELIKMESALHGNTLLLRWFAFALMKIVCCNGEHVFLGTQTFGNDVLQSTSSIKPKNNTRCVQELWETLQKPIPSRDKCSHSVH